MRNPILERRIIPVARPTENQMAVLSKIVAAATPRLAAADISDDPNLSAARDMLEKLGLITLSDEGAFVTDAGDEVMVNQNLATDGRLTDVGLKSAHGDEAEDAAPPEDEFGDLDVGMDFDEPEGDEFDLDDEDESNGKIDLDVEAEKGVHEPRESFALLTDLSNNALMENHLGNVPPDLLNKLTQEEKTQLARIIDSEGDLLGSDLYSKLYSYFVGEMPYGTAKARTGDPDEWIINRLTGGHAPDRDDERTAAEDGFEQIRSRNEQAHKERQRGDREFRRQTRQGNTGWKPGD